MSAPAGRRAARLALGRRAVRLALGGLVAGVLALPLPAEAQPAVEVTSGIRYATHGGVELRLDAYLPAGRGPFPALIVIPGGKWVEVDRTKHADVPAYFAERGIAAFAIDYRSALDAPYPAAVRDVAAAVRWVRSHAERYGVDPAALGTLGVSSGGHLAALVAARGSGGWDVGGRVRVAVSWSGMLDLRPLVDSEQDELREAVRTFLGCPATGPCAPAAAASPIRHVDPTDPPMVLVNGSDEIVPLEQPESMAAALEAAGVQGLVTIAQGGHGAGYGGGDKILDQVFPVIRGWLTGQDVPTSSPQPGSDGGTSAGSAGTKGAEAPAPGATPAPGSPAPGAKQQDDAHAATTASGTSGGVVAVAVTMIAIAMAMAAQAALFARRRRTAGRAGGPTPEVEGT